MVLGSFYTHTVEPPGVSLLAKIRNGFIATWSVPTSAEGKVQRFEVVLSQVKPRQHRIKGFRFKPYVWAKYFSSLEPGYTYEVKVRMKLKGKSSFGPYGNLTVTL